MEKVFIIHGFGGWPNGAWRTWLIGELEKLEIYACALPMPDSQNPIESAWVEEIARQVMLNKNDKIYLVGHSLGVTAILRYLEPPEASKISGAVLVSGPISKTDNVITNKFFDRPFVFSNIKSKCDKFCVIHGDNDPVVPYSDGQTLSTELGCELITISNGGHLNGSAGWHKLPECLEELKKILEANVSR